MPIERARPTRVTGGPCGFPTVDGRFCGGTFARKVHPDEELPDGLIELPCDECGAAKKVSADRIREALDR